MRQRYTRYSQPLIGHTTQVTKTPAKIYTKQPLKILQGRIYIKDTRGCTETRNFLKRVNKSFRVSVDIVQDVHSFRTFSRGQSNQNPCFGVSHGLVQDVQTNRRSLEGKQKQNPRFRVSVDIVQDVHSFKTFKEVKVIKSLALGSLWALYRMLRQIEVL